MTPPPDYFLISQEAKTPPPYYSPPSREAIRATTSAILERPEFRKSSETKSLLKDLGPIDIDLPPLPAPAVWLLLAFFAALLLWLALKLFPAMEPSGPQRTIRKTSSSRWEELDVAPDRWQDALKAVKQAITEKNSRRAVWILHRVFLGLLDKKGAIRFSGWKTNEAYLRECPEADPWRATLLELTRVYDQLVYAHRAVDEGEIQGLVSRVESLGHEVGYGQ